MIEEKFIQLWLNRNVGYAVNDFLYGVHGISHHQILFIIMGCGILYLERNTISLLMGEQQYVMVSIFIVFACLFSFVHVSFFYMEVKIIFKCVRSQDGFSGF